MKRIVLLMLCLLALVTASAGAENTENPPEALELTVTAPQPSGTLSYGQPLSNVTLEGGTVEIGDEALQGRWRFETPDEILTPGTHNVWVRFVPNDSGRPEALCETAVTVRKASPAIEAPTGTAIVYGQALSSSTLKGGSAANPYTAALPRVVGAFAWENRDYVPGVGEQACSAVFMPQGNDEDLYYPVYFTVTIQVERQNLTAVQSPHFASPIHYPEKVGSVAVEGGLVTDASGSTVPGRWAPVAPERVPGVGLGSCLVRFNPDDAIHLAPVEVLIDLEVAASAPALSLESMTLPVGTLLGSRTPAGEAVNSLGERVPGVFTFAENEAVAEGTADYAVLFTPEDTVNYQAATGVCSVTGVKETVTVEAVWSGVNGMSLKDGTLSWSAHDASGAPVTGDLAFSNADLVPAYGTQSAQAVFTPLQEAYETAQVQVSLEMAPREITVTPLDEMNRFYPDAQQDIYYTLSEEVAVTGTLDREAGDAPGRYAVLPGTLTAAEEGFALVLEKGHYVEILEKAPADEDDGKAEEVYNETYALTQILKEAVPSLDGADIAEAFVSYRDRGTGYLAQISALQGQAAFQDARRLDISLDGTRAAILKDGQVTVISLADGAVVFEGSYETASLFSFGPGGCLYLDAGCLDPDTGSLSAGSLPSGTALNYAQPAPGYRLALFKNAAGETMLVEGVYTDQTVTLRQIKGN